MRIVVLKLGDLRLLLELAEVAIRGPLGTHDASEA